MLAMIGDVLNLKVLKGRQKSLTKLKKKNTDIFKNKDQKMFNIKHQLKEEKIKTNIKDQKM